MTRTLLCLARHGETNWNLERRFQGQLDIALNVKGRAQVAALARELAGQRFDHIYSSDLGRARATAAPLAAERGLTVKTTPALREKHDGSWQCLTHSQVAALYPEDYRRYRTRRADFAIPGGEVLEQFAARAASALTRIAEAHVGRTVLVVSHAGVLDIAWRLATGKRLDERREYPVLNAAPNWFAYENGVWSLNDWARQEGRAPVLAPYDGLTPPRRAAARRLVLDPRGDVLLLRYSSRLSPHFFTLGHEHFWGTPGGALQDGESYEAAARRELFEETGLSGVDVGAVVTTREFPMELRCSWVLAVERYFVVNAGRFTPAPRGFTQGEKADVTGWKWWSAEELAVSEELIFPEGLAAELRRIA